MRLGCSCRTKRGGGGGSLQMAATEETSSTMVAASAPSSVLFGKTHAASFCSWCGALVPSQRICEYISCLGELDKSDWAGLLVTMATCGGKERDYETFPPPLLVPFRLERIRVVRWGIHHSQRIHGWETGQPSRGEFGRRLIQIRQLYTSLFLFGILETRVNTDYRKVRLQNLTFHPRCKLPSTASPRHWASS